MSEELQRQTNERLRYVEKIKEACTFLKEKIPNLNPKIGVALGSGLQAFGSALNDSVVINFCDIPHFPILTVKGHKGKLVYGYLDNERQRPIIVFQGRAHVYEGFSMLDVSFYVRIMQFLGVTDFINTNATGGLKHNMHAGDFVVIEDQIHLFPDNPLRGPHIEELGVRFLDMSQVFCPRLQKLLQAACKNTEGVTSGDNAWHTGVYCGVLGPNFESPSEVKYLRSIGGAVVGMSSTPEVMAARHGGLNVGGLSLVTNMGSGMGSKLTHADVVKVANARAGVFVKLLNSFFAEYFAAEASGKRKLESNDPTTEAKRQKTDS